MSWPAIHSPNQCDRHCWIQTVIVLAGLLALAWWAFQEPITPDEDDCRACDQMADCWSRP